MSAPAAKPPLRVVIVGGGFGGLHAARSLARAPARVTLIDRRNFHLFQPLLYQVATGALSPANIAAPLRALVSRQRNAEVLLGEVTGIDVAGRAVLLRDAAVPYDRLIVATGVTHAYFGHDEWERHAPGLKTIEDATAIRARVLGAFEVAERDAALHPGAPPKRLTFAVVGGGPTGVELAGALGEISRHTLRRDFRHTRPEEARILLIEGADRVLPTYPPALSASAGRALDRLGVTVRTGCVVTDIQPECVVLRGPHGTETIAADVVVWAAGVRASPLGALLADATGAALDRVGRVVVNPDLTLPGHPEVMVIGDLAHYAHAGGDPLPGVAQVAMQQGQHAARLIAAQARGETLDEPFRYRDLGMMATIGRAAAVADLGRIKLTGLPGWLAWLFIHLINIVEFENRVLVLLQWAWTYVTRNRAARLIGHYARRP